MSFRLAVRILLEIFETLDAVVEDLSRVFVFAVAGLELPFASLIPSG